MRTRDDYVPGFATITVAELLAEGDRLAYEAIPLHTGEHELSEWIAAEHARRTAAAEAYRIAPVEVAGVTLQVGEFYSIRGEARGWRANKPVLLVARYLGRPYPDSLQFQHFGGAAPRDAAKGLPIFGRIVSIHASRVGSIEPVDGSAIVAYEAREVERRAEYDARRAAEIERVRAARRASDAS